MRKFALIAAVLALAACSDPNAAPKVQIATCDAFTSALATVNALDDKGLIPYGAKNDVRHAVAVAAPICGSGAKLATNTGSAAGDLGGAIDALNSVIHLYGSK